MHSNHLNYGAGIGYDTIKFHGFNLDINLGYAVTHESYDDSKVQGPDYSIYLSKEFDDTWAAYTGYRYSKRNKVNSVFSYGLDDYSKKVVGGVSYRVDERNRLAVGVEYNADAKKFGDVDYYWFHDMHCAQLILCYRSEPNKWKVKLEFTPW